MSWGGYRNFASILLNDKIEAVEGLIVDSHHGGIGFRNHSMPSKANGVGLSWSEDILFFEPETQCVDTNLTLNFVIPDGSWNKSNLALVDRGGFVNIDRNFQWRPDLDDNKQGTLNLWLQAYKGAWINNMLSMQYLGVMNTSWRDSVGGIDSVLGRRYPLPTIQEDLLEGSSFAPDTEAVSSNHFDGSHLPLVKNGGNSTYYRNALHITTDDFHRYGTLPHWPFRKMIALR